MTSADSSGKSATTSFVATTEHPTFDRRLLAYACAATAAGFGLLTSGPTADAKVIYKKVNQPISFNTDLPLDLNHDGVVDFTFVNSLTSSSFGGGFGDLSIFPDHRPNKIMGTNGGGFFSNFAYALPAGKPIGGKGKFPPGAKVLAWAAYAGARKYNPAPATTSCHGPWKNVSRRFLGLKFMITDKVHYGWARLDVSCGDSWVKGALTGYAYETVPNKSILSGQQQDAETTPRAMGSALGQLARGAVGIHKSARK